MTSTQLSFSAFAATQTDLVNFAVSDQSGQRGCFFPQPEFVGGVAPLVTGGCMSRPTSGLRDEFWYEGAGCLDAPGFVSSGGLMSVMVFGKVRPVGVAFRF